MDNDVDSTTRQTPDFVLFALGFAGFLLIVGGIITSAVAVVVAGVLLMVLAISAFQLRP